MRVRCEGGCIRGLWWHCIGWHGEMAAEWMWCAVSIIRHHHQQGSPPPPLIHRPCNASGSDPILLMWVRVDWTLYSLIHPIRKGWCVNYVITFRSPYSLETPVSKNSFMHSNIFHLPLWSDSKTYLSIWTHGWPMWQLPGSSDVLACCICKDHAFL